MALVKRTENSDLDKKNYLEKLARNGRHFSLAITFVLKLPYALKIPRVGISFEVEKPPCMVGSVQEKLHCLLDPFIVFSTKMWVSRFSYPIFESYEDEENEEDEDPLEDYNVDDFRGAVVLRDPDPESFFFEGDNKIDLESIGLDPS